MRSLIQRATMLSSWFAVLVLAAANTGQAHAQTASIVGTVKDVTGASIPKADIRLEMPGIPRLQTVADTDGQFTVEGVPGDYMLKVSSQGFESYYQLVHLTPAAPTTMQVALSVASFSGPVVDVTPLPQIELLNASLTSTLPLSPLPPLKLHSRRSKKLSR
ncbi:carboxypeptidase-like regulatory domain-containing protein [Tunturiibacter empetritectus]|uniref:Carboxypeptidase regulatory-like domain-containing protein n=2 Tax=Tunturiibacter TaxID=3154218 RepID=A0A852VCT8_9BACT|nr:carboxypeptidase-like regulatory domain-containing protein [Edaphobacter lichenicola]NYF90693.1 hypothetical protein [Edaphobacter lichenicola]